MSHDAARILARLAAAKTRGRNPVVLGDVRDLANQRSRFRVVDAGRIFIGFAWLKGSVLAFILAECPLIRKRGPRWRDFLTGASSAGVLRPLVIPSSGNENCRMAEHAIVDIVEARAITR